MILRSRTNNSTHTSCFHRKVKSPYVQQYLAFEERINSHPQHRSQAFKHPLLRVKTQSSEAGDCLLRQAREMIKNRHQVWLEEKQNQLPSIDDQYILGLKEKFDRIKNTCNQSEKPTPLHTQQVSRERPTFSRPEYEHNRSRAVSQSSLKMRQTGKQGPLNFLQYKRSRRELSMKMKRM